MVRNLADDTKQASRFLAEWKPYRGKFIHSRKHAEWLEHGGDPPPELWGEPVDWETAERYLSLGLVTLALRGLVTLGYFLTHVPNVLGIDIDDHAGEAWTGEGEASARLLGLYSQTVSRLGARPSVLVQSPHGLHAYWLFTERIAAEVLHGVASERLAGVDVEIKPTPQTGLRFPVENRLLDPDTFRPLGLEFAEAVDRAEHYHPAILFDESYLPETIREDLKTRKTRARSLRHLPRLELVERSVLPLEDGATNDAVVRLIACYKGAGLSPEEAAYRLRLVVEASPTYDGRRQSLRNPRELEKRVRSMYRRSYRDYTPEPRELPAPDLFEDGVVEAIVERSPFAPQRNGPVRRMVRAILRVKRVHDAILADKGMLATWDYLYMYYRRARKLGYYPLPAVYLRRVNDRYNELVEFLQGIGFLERGPWPYDPEKHVCRYYRVHVDPFIPRE